MITLLVLLYMRVGCDNPVRPVLAVITLFVLLYMRVGCDNTVRPVIYED